MLSYRSRLATFATALLGIACAWPVSAQAQGTPSIIEAVRGNDLRSLQTLLSNGADPNARQGDGATSLHWAAHRDDLEAAELLIEAGADVNVSNDLGATPLWLSAVNGSTAFTQLLLEEGASPDKSLKMGETPLMTAARSGGLGTVELLLEAGADVDAAELERGQTALMWSAAQGHPNVIRALVDAAADVHTRSKVWYQLENTAGNTNPVGNFDMAHGGSTALLFVARNGDVETARALIEAGADVNDIAASGTSALVIAAHSSNTALAIFLLEQGADPNGAGAGYTALHAAVLRGQVELVQALLDHGANVNAIVQHGTPGRRFSADFSIRHQYIGTNALWLAAKFGEPEIVRTLADHGAVRTRVPDNGSRFAGMSVIQAAMGMTGSTTLENRRDRVSGAPDNEADERITLELAQIIVGLGADVNQADSQGNTALHHAVRKNFPSVVEFLLSRGADIHATNERDQTPLILAETPQVFPHTNGILGLRPMVAEVLRRFGATD